MIDSHSFFLIWLSFAVLTVCAIVPFVIWAIRSGQFSKFDYASHLPLRSMIVEEKPANKNQTSIGSDRKKENVPT